MAQTDGVGTKKAGYADPHYGPFRCGNCIWFRQGGTCAHPELAEDKQVPKDDEGHPQVDHDGCCNYFRTKNLNLSGIMKKAMKG